MTTEFIGDKAKFTNGVRSEFLHDDAKITHGIRSEFFDDGAKNECLNTGDKITNGIMNEFVDDEAKINNAIMYEAMGDETKIIKQTLSAGCTRQPPRPDQPELRALKRGSAAMAKLATVDDEARAASLKELKNNMYSKSNEGPRETYLRRWQ